MTVLNSLLRIHCCFLFFVFFLGVWEEEGNKILPDHHNSRSILKTSVLTAILNLPLKEKNKPSLLSCTDSEQYKNACFDCTCDEESLRFKVNITYTVCDFRGQHCILKEITHKIQKTPKHVQEQYEPMPFIGDKKHQETHK